MAFASRLAVLLVAVAACSTPDTRIPSVDGALALQVRYPSVATRVPPSDSIALWGTVGTGRATLVVNNVRVSVEPNGTFATFLPVPAGPSPSLHLVARHGVAVAESTIRLRRDDAAVARDDAAPVREDSKRSWSRWVTMRRPPSDTADSATQSRPIYARWRPSGEVAIGIAQGIRLFADARTDRWIRLRLAPDEHVWVPILDVDTVTPPRGELVRAGRLAIEHEQNAVRFVIPLSERLPSVVELSGDRLSWSVYGARWAVRPAPLAGDGRPIRRIVIRDTAPERLTVDLGLTMLPLGWRVDWHNGALQLLVRRPSQASPSLRGLRVTLDAGHPPDGTIGPSGLMEDSITLAVARLAAETLQRLGAVVRLTRRDSVPLSLEARAAIADRDPAQLFISIHLNAPGPGRPPDAVFGTQTYWMNPNGRALASVLLAEVARSMGHPAIGVYQGDYAVLRSAWATAALVEGSGIVLPEREAFLRTPGGVAAYAQGVVNGIVRWQATAAMRELPTARRR